MGQIELWLGPAGCGKTGRALTVLREECARDWRGVRFLAPTVQHKRSLEHLLLDDERAGLFGDPITTFYNFAEEVTRLARIDGRHLSDIQKMLLLKDIVKHAPLEAFKSAVRYAGFTQALGEIIDELKVSMIPPERLADAAKISDEAALSPKLGELGLLYTAYQQHLLQENLFDNEGIMWIAAEALRNDQTLLSDLRCLILDGFARLTPVQIDFLAALAPRVGRVIVILNYEEHRSLPYHPVEDSLRALEEMAAREGVPLARIFCPARGKANNALGFAHDELFRDRHRTRDWDESVRLISAATPAREADCIAQEIRALLREGKITPDQIVILARNPESVRERIERALARYGVPIRLSPPFLSHTTPGRMLLASIRLAREGWKREDVLTLLKSGCLPIDHCDALRIDIIARMRHLREKREAWTEQWPDDDTRPLLDQALEPLLAFDKTFRERADLPAAAGELLRVFRQHALADSLSFPNDDAERAGRLVALEAAFVSCEKALCELSQISRLRTSFNREEALEAITASLMHAKAPMQAGAREGIRLLGVNATGGEKFAVVFLCDMLQGAFPLHQRESAFLMDHEREGPLRGMGIAIDTRRGQEDDERYWFLHAFASATRQIILSYPQHDAAGGLLETSSFIDEVRSLIPEIDRHARTTTFRDQITPIEMAESEADFIASLVHGLRTTLARESPREHTAISNPREHNLAAAYTALLGEPRLRTEFTGILNRAACPPAELRDERIQRHLAARIAPFSASELQAYRDCPFLWFGQYALRAAPIAEQFCGLERGTIIHDALEHLFRSKQRRAGEPVHLEQEDQQALLDALKTDVVNRLNAEPLFVNRASFLKDIERERLLRMLEVFLRREIERISSRQAHPAYFERSFGGGHHPPLDLCGGVTLRGTIDRIDILDGDRKKAMVIDYKSSTSMSLKSIGEGAVLQAPIYALALEKLYGFEPLGAEFIGIKGGAARGVYHQDAPTSTAGSKGMKTYTGEEWRQYLDTQQESLRQTATAIKESRIALDPATDRCPTRCDYFALCRGQRFILERMARRKGDAQTEE